MALTRRQFGGLVAKVLGAIGLVKATPPSRVISSGLGFTAVSDGQTQHIQRYWRIVMKGERQYLEFSDDANFRTAGDVM